MSLILMSLFILLAVIVRIISQYLKTGDHGVRLAKSDAPLIEIVPGTLFVLSFCFAFIIVCLGYNNKITETVPLTNSIELIGFAVGMLGISITLLSQAKMGKSWRIGVDSDESTTLVTSGIYAKSRNPIYFGILLFWIGLCLTFAHVLLWLCAIICWLCIEPIVRKVEEPYLTREHGEHFQKYLDRTHRYLPI